MYPIQNLYSEKKPAGRGLRHSILVLTLLTLTLPLAGCKTTPFQRSLPQWVNRIYIPMAENRSYEPGLEEKITSAFTEEVLSNGELDVTQKNHCDAIVKIIIKDYRERSEDFSSDDIESYREVVATLAAELYDPSDEKTPFGVVEDFEVDMRYRSEFRSTRSTTTSDARDEFAERCGLQLMRAVLGRVRITRE
ncbi:MAG TPA: LPS assembly lipoprotein LptE [Candidatus Sumerlaeota bacterium]|nr:LPS assembly lipoprotein LptE [Candidatus Sumerlaeota bacterium]HPS02648.1 LPS assembly lipoprotein LptE [Candidatus Sumerlaeota bacterium]